MTDQDGKGLFQSLPLTRPAAPPVRELEEALILPGDRIPEFILPDANAQLQRFYELVRGRPTVLVLVANTARQEQWDEIKGYADIAPALDAAGVDLFIVTNDGVELHGHGLEGHSGAGGLAGGYPGRGQSGAPHGRQIRPDGRRQLRPRSRSAGDRAAGRRAGPGRLGLLGRPEAPGRGAAGPGRHRPGPDPAPRPR